jgi:peptide/nickel transport system substrate-binding protein
MKPRSRARGWRSPICRGWRLAFTALLLLAAGCVILTGCGRARESDRSGDWLRVEIETSPSTLDPRYATDVISSRIGELIYDSLVKADSRGGFAGDLAQSIERPTPTLWVFHLARRCRFSNGKLLTARDVKYTYDSAMNPASASLKRGSLAALARVDAPDAFTVSFTTNGPFAAALELATLGVVPAGTPANGPRGLPPPGSGPFKLARFERDEEVVLERNSWWAGQASAMRGIVFKVMPDAIVRALELMKGLGDFAENNVPAQMLGDLQGRRALRVVRYAGVGYQYLIFNFRDPRLRDIRVRRAIAMAIDRQAIVNSLLARTARVASGMLAPENWAYEPEVATYSYDPAAAARLLDEAGLRAPAGEGPGTRFTLVYKTTGDEERRSLAQVFQAMLAKVGIRLDVRTNEWATFYSDIQHGDFDVASLAWVGINDPHHYYTVFDSKMLPPHGSNRGYYSNAKMDELLERAEVEMDRDARRRIYGAVQKLAAADLPYVSLWWQDNVTIMNRRVRGFAPYPNGSWRSFAMISLDGTGEVDR